jgi:4-amino-4-deoxy-L-arabinose transferase-like glycosyltransferase
MPHMAAGDKVTWGRGDGVNITLSPFPRVILLFIISAYLIIGCLYAALTPAWQVPDEPAHYNVIRQIAQTGTLPQLELGDYDQEYNARLTAEKFPPSLPLDHVQYQDYQPPLYYLLATPIFLLFNGSLTALRLFSLLLGAGVIALAYLAVREVAGDEIVPLLAAGFIAFIPQHIAMLAGVNNDSLAELLIALGLFLVLRAGHESHSPYAFIHGRWPLAYKAWVFGGVLGAAFLTKVQAYVLAPVFAAYVWLQWRRRPVSERPGVLRWAAIVFGLASALGVLYWGRNFLVCGLWDVVCGNWHNRVVDGQPTPAEWLAMYGWWGSDVALLNRFFTFTFDSFWGVFGWMGVFMPSNVYLALQIFCVAVVIGVAAAARRWQTLTEAQRDGALLLTLSALVTVGLYLYYNVNFVQHQGRYLFPALIPLGAVVAVGLRQWGKWLRALRLPLAVEVAAPFIPVVLLATLAVFALYRLVIPALS